MMNVLLDGWSLVYLPDSPQALHLMTLVAHSPSDVRYTLALPGAPPDWLLPDIEIHAVRTRGNAWGQLLWEQRSLPLIAREVAADLIHLTKPMPPLVSPIPTVLSPSIHPRDSRAGGLGNRVRTAFAAGGMSRLKALLWPADLPSPRETSAAVYTLPPVVLPGFLVSQDAEDWVHERMDLPETFILYNGPVDVRSIQRLSEVWSWAVGPIGEYYPLLIAGLHTDPSQEKVGELPLRSGTPSGLHALPVLNPRNLPYIYHRSTLVVHVNGIAPWGNSARNALAGAKPFVAVMNPEIDAVVGPAAYLAAEEDQRSLGAALITVVVEDSLAEQLSRAARQRSSAWDPADFKKAIKEVYASVCSG